VSPGLRRGLVLAALIAAGEAVFLLPFVLARVFRPTFLDVFGITNLQLGTAFSLYGVVAMAAYFGGGPLADRFSARRLMSTALVATGLGGMVLAGIPTTRVMNLLWAAWGLTTILLFWAAMIRATREWGGVAAQGRAYGLLDGGRGLLAALIASGSVVVFAALLPTDAASATPRQQAEAFQAIIWVFTGTTVLIGVLVWLLVPDTAPADEDGARPKLSVAGVRRACRMPTVWLQAVIVVCAYAGYKATDDFSLLARDALGFDDVQASIIGTLSFWVRAISAVGAGYLGDRIDASRVVLMGFAALTGGSVLIASGLLPPGVPWMLITTIVATSVGVYALRGVYFALLAEGAVPLPITGSAVGVVSFLGFTPDVFMGPLMGVLLDGSPGVLGHRHVFAAVAGFGAVGFIATVAFRRVTRHAGGPSLVAPAALMCVAVGAAAAPRTTSAQVLDLPPRAATAPAGSEIARELVPLDLQAREARILVEITRGNVPGWLRRLQGVEYTRTLDGSRRTVRVLVTADYLAVGSDLDYFLVPLSPRTAQAVADRVGASLPTPTLVDAVWHAAFVRLGPDSLPPGPEMTTVPVFVQHDRMVRSRRIRSGAPFGVLVAGHKKDVVLSSALQGRAGHVAIYGWHRPDARPIQPVYAGHTDDWIDYSHGIRLVYRTIWIDGEPADLLDVLRDPRLAPLVSDEGPLHDPRYRIADPGLEARASSDSAVTQRRAPPSG
jgi:MFS family permease